MDFLSLAFHGISTKLESGLKQIEKKYGVPSSEMYAILEESFRDTARRDEDTATVSSQCSSVPASRYEAMKRADLIYACKQRNILGVSHKSKQQLIDTLVGSKSKIEVNTENKVVIRKNKYGSYEHSETGFVFSTAQVVIGKQVEEQVVPLSKEDVEKCILYKWRYQTPVSLDREAEGEETHEQTIDRIEARVKEGGDVVDDEEEDEME